MLLCYSCFSKRETFTKKGHTCSANFRATTSAALRDLAGLVRFAGDHLAVSKQKCFGGVWFDFVSQLPKLLSIQNVPGKPGNLSFKQTTLQPEISADYSKHILLPLVAGVFPPQDKQRHELTSYCYTPWQLTCPLTEKGPFQKERIVFQSSFLRGYISYQGILISSFFFSSFQRSCEVSSHSICHQQNSAAHVDRVIRVTTQPLSHMKGWFTRKKTKKTCAATKKPPPSPPRPPRASLVKAWNSPGQLAVSGVRHRHLLMVFFSRQKRHGFQLPIFSKEFPSSEAEKITGTRNFPNKQFHC